MAKKKRGGVRNKPHQNAKAPIREHTRSGQTTSDGNRPHHYTLAEEARYTEHRRAKDGDPKLRNTYITFVSASGNTAVQSDVEEEDSITQPSAEPHLDEVSADPSSSSSTLSQTDVGVPNDGAQRDAGRTEIADELYVIDTVGLADIIQTGLPPPTISDSKCFISDHSDSSEEVVLFAGRERARQRRKGSENVIVKSLTNSMAQKPHAQDRNPTGSPMPVVSTQTSVSNLLGYGEDREDLVSRQSKKTHRKSRLGRRPFSVVGKPCHSKKQSEGEILADYIINAQENNTFNNIDNANPVDQRDIGDDAWQDENEEVSGHEKPDNTRANPGLDFENISTSNASFDNVVCVLSKRNSSSGTQYLVVGEGCSVDEARWIPLAFLQIPGAAEQIRAFEAKQTLIVQEWFEADKSDTMSNTSGLAALDLEDDFAMAQEEEDFLKQRKADMTDEQMARLLSKQEELGLGSKELTLFDGFEDTEGRRRKRPSSSYTSANLWEKDPYDGFDVMDFMRPSISSAVNGRHSLVKNLDWSVPDFEKSMNLAWEKDRMKKKKIKREREELRAQGLLPEKNNRIDLKTKYSSGMTFEQAKDEIKMFLLSTHESLPLPPMDKRDRKMIHELASVFALKSKSVGAGKSRFPVLIKTSRTVDVEEEDVLGMLNQRRFFPRRDRQISRGFTRAKGPNKKCGAGRGGSGAAVSYRDGEVVGAAAPELGSENRGRAMLEKMGWSTGTALGALNNKGIMQPVLHVVKTTKAGLG